MSILALDATGSRAGVAVLNEGGAEVFKRFAAGRPGLIETLPLLLAEAATAHPPTQIAVTIGPGSFTGLRTAISLAQGFAAASGLPLLGVPVAEAYAIALPALHRPLWVAIRVRRDRLFLLRGDLAEAYDDAAIPRAKTPIALAGDAANEIAARLAAAGMDVMLTNARQLDPAWVALAARARLAAGQPPHPAQPLYIEPAQAKLPASGLRAAPA